MSSLRTLKFGPSTRSRSWTFSAPPSAPTTSRLWQPAQLSLNSRAPFWITADALASVGGGWLVPALGFWVPQAVPSAADATARTASGTRRDMGAGSYESDSQEGPAPT